jgi:superfamily I DNA/RNA helicase
VHSAKGRRWRYVGQSPVCKKVHGRISNDVALSLGAERLVERVRHGDEIAQVALDMIAASSLAEDEARLFRVATTRARQSLLVTAISREDDTPSIFFEDLAEWLGATGAGGGESPKTTYCIRSGRYVAPRSKSHWQHHSSIAS